MELNHDFQVSVPIEDAWAVLTDLERIAPCMPGAQLLEVDGDEYRGVVKVKVGPITASYKGVARIVELDPKGHRAVLRAEGRETRGQGTAAATVTATLESRGSDTGVHIATDLDISGKVAQFGRGVLGEVSEKILDQFVKELEDSVLSAGPVAGDGGEGADDSGDAPSAAPSKAGSSPSGGGGAGSGSVETAAGPRAIDSVERPPVDLLDAAGGSVLKRLLPLLGVLALFGIVRRLRRRR